MLRASVEANQGKVDLRAISEGAKDDSVGVAHAAELTKAGSEVVVDAAGVIANFERMTRIADGTGIPLDAAPQLASHDFREALGLNAFASAGNTPALPGWRRALLPLFAPAAKKAMARFLRR